jgi:hypothetical protein
MRSSSMHTLERRLQSCNCCLCLHLFKDSKPTHCAQGSRLLPPSLYRTLTTSTGPVTSVFLQLATRAASSNTATRFSPSSTAPPSSSCVCCGVSTCWRCWRDFQLPSPSDLARCAAGAVDPRAHLSWLLPTTAAHGGTREESSVVRACPLVDFALTTRRLRSTTANADTSSTVDRRKSAPQPRAQGAG